MFILVVQNNQQRVFGEEPDFSHRVPRSEIFSFLNFSSGPIPFLTQDRYLVDLVATPSPCPPRPRNLLSIQTRVTNYDHNQQLKVSGRYSPVSIERTRDRILWLIAWESGKPHTHLNSVTCRILSVGEGGLPFLPVLRN